MKPNDLPVNTSRRHFLVTSGTFSLAVVFTGCAGAPTEPSLPKVTVKPNAWMTLASDGTVTLFSPASEMGQGTLTAMPLLVAEEMDLDWDRCVVQQSAFSPKDFGNPRFGGGMTTGASRTVQGYWDPIRLAGAQARQVLINAAAARWNVAASEVSTEPHTCVHKATGRKLSYGEIASFIQVPTVLPKVEKSQLKKVAAYRLIGKDIARRDAPEKTTGKAKFGIDTRLPGMLYATVARAPVQGETPQSVDDTKARAVKGVRNIVRLPYGVAVVADNTWAAEQAKRALAITWSRTSPARKYSSDTITAAYRQRANDLADKGVTMETHGDIDKALSVATKTIDAFYTCEHVAHFTIEPMNATAWVREGTIEVWAPSQSASFVMGATTSALGGFKPEQVKINITYLGGGYGRRVEADYVLDAVLVAKAMPGTPIQVIWSREDDIMRDKLRPIMVQRVTAALDSAGNLSALRHRMVSESIYARVAPPLFANAGGKDAPACEGFEIKYAVTNHHATYHREQRGIDVGFWRGVGGGYTKFALETIIDEAARAAQQDPVTYRLAMLAKEPRAQAVIRECAAMAQWDGGVKRVNRALGFAYSDMWNTHCAMVVDVSVEGKKIVVHNIWSAVDAGVAIMPRNVQTQIEGSALFGVSAALKERLTVKEGEFVQRNLNDYPVLRMDEAPGVTVKVIVTDNHPGGIGEVGLPPVAPAIANAVASITGQRLRDLPLRLA
jgi:isoquinoline 1-oxidoreductase beta subunit